MSKTVQDLERLASVLTTKAETAEAQAQECAKFKEIAEAERHTNRALNARMFAQTCLDAAAKLKVRAKRQQFLPPTWEEALDYASNKFPEWPHADVLSWWNHFECVGWKVGNGKPMVNWQRAADNGYSNFKKRAPKEKQAQGTLGFVIKPDPEGWREFLKNMKYPYKEYRYSADWIKADFGLRKQ